MTSRSYSLIALGLVLAAGGATPLSALAVVRPGEVILRTNADRLAAGLSPLSENALLNKAAQLKADDMATRGYYAHVSPDGKSPLYWLDAAGYKYMNAGENLDANATSAESAQIAWMHSSEHRKNILRAEFTQIGIGVADGQYKGHDSTFVVQMFGTPYPLTQPAKKTEPVKAPALPTPKPVPLVPFTKPAPPLIQSNPKPISSGMQDVVGPITKSLAGSTTATTTPVKVSGSRTATSTAAAPTPAPLVPRPAVSGPVVLIDAFAAGLPLSEPKSHKAFADWWSGVFASLMELASFGR